MPSTEPIQQGNKDEFSIINSWFYLYRSATVPCISHRNC